MTKFIEGFPIFLQMGTDGICFIGPDNKDHADTHIKGAVHFLPRHVAPFLEFLEDRRHFHASA